MRAATLLFYAVVTFCLGNITILAGGSRTLAQLFGADPIIQNGFPTYPTEPWQSILLYGTFGMTLVFVVLALYFAATSEPPLAVYDVRPHDEDENDDEEVNEDSGVGG